MKIYVASSWRNHEQPFLVRNLRYLGHEVYDFRNPPHGNGGFSWSAIDPNWVNWTPDQWRAALDHPLALDGFKADLEGMQWADMCVCLLPCGRSAHLEAGWFIGKGKPTFFFAQQAVEPDLMVLLGNGIVTSMVELDNAIHYFSTNHTSSNSRASSTQPDLLALLEKLVGDVRDIHDIESIRYDDVLAAQAAIAKVKS